MKKVIILIQVVIIVLTIILISQDKPVDDTEIIKNIAYNLNDVNRIRYEGYNNQDQIIDRIFTEELALEIKNNLKNNSENTFISYENQCKENEKAIADAQSDTTGFNQLKGLNASQSDSRLKTNNNERGFYLSDIENIGNEAVLLCGIETIINADTSQYIGSLIGNKYYDFEVEYYYMYKKQGLNVLKVRTRSKDLIDPYIIEYTCYLDSNYKIKEMENIELLYSKLLRKG